MRVAVSRTNITLLDGSRGRKDRAPRVQSAVLVRGATRGANLRGTEC
jgi:hypothetical protein